MSWMILIPLRHHKVRSATMNVDSPPMSSVTNDSRCADLALHSRLKTMQLLGPEASAAIAKGE